MFFEIQKPVAAIALAVIFLGGCAGMTGMETGSTSFSPTSLSQTEEDQIKKIVADGLIDPESARFSDFYAAADTTGVIHVCGEVNAKNRFGGYTGRQPFYGKITRTGSGSSLSMVANGVQSYNLSFSYFTCNKVFPEPRYYSA